MILFPFIVEPPLNHHTVFFLSVTQNPGLKFTKLKLVIRLILIRFKYYFNKSQLPTLFLLSKFHSEVLIDKLSVHLNGSTHWMTEPFP